MKDEDQPKKHIQTEETHPTQIQTEKTSQNRFELEKNKYVKQIMKLQNPYPRLSVTPLIRDALVFIRNAYKTNGFFMFLHHNMQNPYP